MPRPLLSFFMVCITGVKRSILKKKIDQAEAEQQSEMERETDVTGVKRSIFFKIDQAEAELQSGMGVTGVKRSILEKKIDQAEAEQQSGMERGAIIQNISEIDGSEEEEEEQHEEERICENLPEELMIESILTRLPARTLAISCCVSKLWYNSILNDSRFSVIHHIQNKNKFYLVFNLLNVLRGGTEGIHFFSLVGENGDSRIQFLSGFNIRKIHELVGFCNGLACMKLVSAPNDAHGAITVVNPIRGESLVLSYVPPTGGYIYLCHGFGFDSSSQVYKAVIVFTSKAHNELLCMVITLGTISWRKIITTTLDISPPPGSSPFPSPMVIRTLCRPATFCGGDLFWRTHNTFGNNNDKIEMLLSFDLHDEKIHFIRLPIECTPTRATNQPQYLVVDHLLEFKGYPCIARFLRIIGSNNDCCGHRCNYQTGVCCCCYKVLMYMLKDKDKQVWTREETFDVQINDQKGLLPTHLCWYFDTSAATPPTRIVTFSDQVLLYWFNGVRLVFYNLQEKHLRVVECSLSCPSVFQSKMNEDLERRIGDDDNIYCPSMDYQLHAQVENIVSLTTFIPKGAKISETDCVDELKHLISNDLAAGWLTTGRTKRNFFAFF